MTALAAFSTVAGNTITSLRSRGDRYNSVANALSLTVDGTEWSKYHIPKTSVQGQLMDFMKRIKAKYGDDTGAAASHVTGIVKDIMEGSSFNEAFDTKKTSEGRFNVADYYEITSRREDGPPLSFTNIQAGTSYLLGNLGLRGVQWGNYVTDGEREHHLQQSAQALTDLAQVLNLSLPAVGAKLGLAIGARGKGSALAHYEPDRKVINLTRKGGVGSLAHEWGHFMDNALAGGDPNHFTSAGKDGREFQTLMSGLRTRCIGILRKIPDAFMSVKKKNYWIQPEEIFARTFERYVQLKLKDAGMVNTYLAGVKEEGGLWPTDEEVRKAAPVIEKFIDAYRLAKQGSVGHTSVPSHEEGKVMKVETGTDRADEWLHGIVRDVQAIENEHGRLLAAARHTDRFRKELSKGTITQSQFDDQIKKGLVLNDADYARALTVQARIAETKARPFPAI